MAASQIKFGIQPEDVVVTSCGCALHMKGFQFRANSTWATIKRLGVGQQFAHRVSWEQFNGPIPEGLWVLHKCDVGCCVNPDHLFLGTAKDNAIDRQRKGRSAKVSLKFLLSMKGNRQTKEHTDKIVNTLYGNKRGAGTKGYKHTAETRNNMAVAQRHRREQEKV